MPTTTGLTLTVAHRRKLSAAMAAHGRMAEVAAAVGIDRRHLYAILKGRKRPSADTLAAICREAGVRVRVRTAVELS